MEKLEVPLPFINMDLLGYQVVYDVSFGVQPLFYGTLAQGTEYHGIGLGGLSLETSEKNTIHECPGISSWETFFGTTTITEAF